MVVNCDICNKDFEVEIRTKHDCDLEMQYFICPYCNKKYVYVIIDDYIREKRKELEHIKDRVKECTKQKQLNRLNKEYNKILKDMKKHSDELIKNIGFNIK